MNEFKELEESCKVEYFEDGFAYFKADDVKDYLEVLIVALKTNQKAYNKQHDYYRGIFISLVKLERELELLKKINHKE
jgi:hypothetical protein